ncbi:MAG: cryptochrome/photolyase family protein [Chromatiales bacterium]|nr:cryptochrome/photolyase family protein [Chromatiales bacterium]
MDEARQRDVYPGRAAVSTIRRLVVVLGDQLDPEAPWHDGFEPARDAVWMAEVAGEARRVWSHKARIALFLTAMRHHRDALRARGVTVHYRALEDGPAPEDSSGDSLAAALDRFLADARVSELVMVEAGEWGVAGAIAVDDDRVPPRDQLSGNQNRCA